MRPLASLEWIAACTPASLAPVLMSEAEAGPGILFIDWGRAYPSPLWPVVAVQVLHLVRGDVVEVDPRILEALVSGHARALPDAMHALIVATDNFSRGLLGWTTPLARVAGCLVRVCFETSLGLASLTTTIRPEFLAVVAPNELCAQPNPLACLFVDPVDDAVRFYAQGLWNDRGVWYIVDGELLDHLALWFQVQTTARLRRRLRAFLRSATGRGCGSGGSIYALPSLIRQAVSRLVLAPFLPNPFSRAPCDDPCTLDDASSLPILPDPDLFAHDVSLREAAITRAMAAEL